MWRVCKASGRPWPVLDDDPVIDYMLMEVTYIKAQKEEQRAAEEAERKRQVEEARAALVKEFGG